MSEIIVIKVGTGVLTRDDGTLDDASLSHLVCAVAGLVKDGYRCLMVSSGAVGAGAPAFQLTEYPKDIETKQAAAAVGQTRLMYAYQNLFGESGLTVAQLLLSGEDLSSDRRRRVRRTLDRLLKEESIIPIVNENDTVATEELRVGDNDLLSARVAELIDAKKLILLTGVDGLLSSDGEVISEVSRIDDVLKFVREEQGRFSMGGMASKLEAVRYATEKGVEVIIAAGRHPERLPDILKGGGIRTRFCV